MRRFRKTPRRGLGALMICLGWLAGAAGAGGGEFRGPLGGASEMAEIAGRNVAIWRPEPPWSAPPPLIVISHGFTACSTSSAFLAAALAKASYLVVAPDHADSSCVGRPPRKPEKPFGKPRAWNADTYRRRGNDIANLLAEMKSDSEWSVQFDAGRIALMGHSLGGYVVLSLAGARPSWRLPDVKAVVAMAPLIGPLLANGKLGEIEAPVMYQLGAKDTGTTSLIKRKSGAFDRTKSGVLAELAGANHFAWGGTSPRLQNLIAALAVSFVDAHLKGKKFTRPASKTIRTFRTKE
jgi:predicted dienelactone hydrolase